MKRNILAAFCVILVLGITANLFTQERAETPATTQPISPVSESAKNSAAEPVNQELSSSLRGMNPRNLVRMREDLTG
ncbi:MAG: hypothetical protein ACRC2T_15125, partial [Thermoguttaceae bacterium]